MTGTNEASSKETKMNAWVWFLISFVVGVFMNFLALRLTTSEVQRKDTAYIASLALCALAPYVIAVFISIGTLTERTRNQ